MSESDQKRTLRQDRLLWLISVTADQDAAKALNRLQARDVRQLPVMRIGSLTGLLRRRDLVKRLPVHSEEGLE